ncbi:MAG: aminotransferase class V-fold PLP-dependent enzyme, partial [Alphaproteobacteria bacterium]
MVTFGRSLRPLWHLAPEGVFLNHGSFGACPKAVLDAQTRWRETMERQPDVFFRRTTSALNPDNGLRQAAARLGQFIGARGDHIAFVSNLTEAVSTVLRGMPLSAGDEILLLDCVYNSVRRAVDEKCHETGARPVIVDLPLPLDPDLCLARVEAAVTANTRLAILDHIASAPALMFPVKAMTKALQAKGVRVLVDGAHALGHVGLAIDDIGADWYTANAHKWLYAPKGTAFLHARDPQAIDLRPLATSHYVGEPFPLSFDYVGTRDVTAFLTVPDALDFIEGLGGAATLQAYMHDLSRAGQAMMARLGLQPIAPDTMFAAMHAYHLPQRRAVAPEDALEIIDGFWDRHRIQVAASAYLGRLVLRLSAQAYVGIEDYAQLADVLEREGWPGR